MAIKTITYSTTYYCDTFVLVMRKVVVQQKEEVQCQSFVPLCMLRSRHNSTHVWYTVITFRFSSNTIYLIMTINSLRKKKKSKNCQTEKKFIDFCAKIHVPDEQRFEMNDLHEMKNPL